MTHRALIYVRQSTHKEESISLENQETSAREHCARHGYDVVDVIADDGVSGLQWDKREGVQRLLKRVAAGDADRVIVWRWSRLSRRSVHQHLAIDRIESHGAIVESSTEPFDTKTAGGTFGRDVMLASAAFESSQKSEQWREAHDRRLRVGLPASGRARYGYTWHSSDAEERYEVDEGEAEVVRWIYASYNAGRGIPSIVRELNRNGIVSKNGQEWNRRKLTTYLESGFAAGLIVRVGNRTGKTYSRVPFHRREFVRGSHEPIISEQVWEDFTAIKAGRSQIPPRSISPTNSLSGLVKCGDCSGAMTRHVTKTRSKAPHPHVGFTCSNRNSGKAVRSVSISETRLYAVVFEWLSDVADEVGQDASEEADHVQEQLRTRTDLDEATNRVTEIDTQLRNLTKQLVAGRVPEDTYDETRDELLRERSEAEDRRKFADVQARSEPVEPANVTARGLLDEWDTLPVEDRNALLRKLVRHVLVEPPEAPRGRASAQVIPVWA